MTMLLYVGSIGLFLCAVNIALVESQDFQTWNSDGDDIIAAYNIRGIEGRHKRGVTIAQRGLAALNKLLTGTNKVRTTSKDHRKYTKHGNFETAKKDFFSVRPTNVRTRQSRDFSVRYPTGKVISGNVGNRRLILKENGGAGQPVIEVIETKFEPGPYIDQITYDMKKAPNKN